MQRAYQPRTAEASVLHRVIRAHLDDVPRAAALVEAFGRLALVGTARDALDPLRLAPLTGARARRTIGREWDPPLSTL